MTASHPKSEVQTFYFASPWSRLGAWAIDGLILSLTLGLFSLFLVFYVPALNDFRVQLGEINLQNLESVPATPFILSLVWIVGGIAYHSAMLVYFGQTLGKMLFRVKVLTVEGAPLGWGTAVIRSASAFLLSRQILWVGYIWAFFQPQQQTWHDMLARTYVVQA